MKKQFILLIKLILSASLIVYLLNKIPLNEIVNSIQSANFVLIVSSLIIYLSCHYLSAIETRYLTNILGIIVSPFQILKIHLTTMFYNLFLPGFISGGAVKWFKFSKYGSKSDAAAVVAFNRFLETLMIVLTGIIYSIPILSETGNDSILILGLVFLVIIITAYFLLLNQKFLSISEKVILKISFSQKIGNSISNIFNSIKKFRKLSLKENIQIFGLLFFYHSLGITSVYLLALSLEINITFFDVAWMRSAINILTMLPFSFAGLGIREVSLVFFLGKYGVKPDTAMAYSLLIFFNITIASLSGGLIEFLDFITNKKTITNSSVKQ